jgi:integrase
VPKRRGRGDGGIRQRADGRWEGSVEDGYRPNGTRRRRFVYGRTRAEVVEKLRAEQTRLTNGLPATDQRQTTEQFLRWWIDHVIPGAVSRGAEDTYRAVLELYVIPYLGRVPLPKLTPAHVTQMMRAMARGELSKKPLSPATQNQARKILAIALRRAEQEGYILRNVARLADAPRMTRRQLNVLTPEEIRVLFSVLRDERLGCAYLLQLALGLRKGEVLGMSWTDLDLEGPVPILHVRTQIKRYARDGLQASDLKTPKSRRDLVVPQPLVEDLRVWRSVQARERLALGPAWGNEMGLVFTTPLGTPVDPANYLHRLQRILRNAGLSHHTTHELRHSAGSILFAKGVPMKLISEMLGHSSERITADVYVHTDQSHREAVAAAMTTALWPGPPQGGASGAG